MGMGGSGFPRQKLDKAQVALRSMVSLADSPIWLNNGFNAPAANILSLNSVLSPAIFPNPQIACSFKSSKVEFCNKFTRPSMAPSLTINSVAISEPDAMLVNDHAA